MVVCVQLLIREVDAAALNKRDFTGNIYALIVSVFTDTGNNNDFNFLAAQHSLYQHVGVIAL